MAPRVKFTKELVLNTAFNFVRREGEKALTARTLAKELNSSVKPIFDLFGNMEGLKEAVWDSVKDYYNQFLLNEIKGSSLPVYKASGLGYIRFAKEEAEFFKLLFMRTRAKVSVVDEKSELKSILSLIQENLGLNEEQAYQFHTEMWVVTHGIATAVVTGFIPWDEEWIGRVLTDHFVGLSYRFSGVKNGSN